MASIRNKGQDRWVSIGNRLQRIIVAFSTVLFLMLSGTVVASTLGPAPQKIAQYDRSFIERSGAQTFGEMLDTGILRYFFTGGRNLLVMVNGRPYATTGQNLDSLPLSAIERIEVYRAESLGTIAGEAAVRGAFNLILRTDLEGFDVRTVVRQPSRDGGEARQGSVVWGDNIGTDGFVTVGVDIFKRNEIPGNTRPHSRSEWTEGGDFADAKNVSVGGNTAYILDREESAVRTLPIGDCDEADGYAGVLNRPSGATSNDQGCGYAYGDIWWDAPGYEHNNAVLNLSSAIGDNVDLQVDANVSKGREKLRYAPSVGSFTITPNAELLQALNQAASDADNSFVVDSQDTVTLLHRFIGHGNRDWTTDTKEYDLSASFNGQVTDQLDYDTRISFYRYDGFVVGNTFVDTEAIQREIASGAYNVIDPKDPNNQQAIERTSLTQLEDIGSSYKNIRFALEGSQQKNGNRDLAWTAGFEIARTKAHRLLRFRGHDDRILDVAGVLGAGGTSYIGKRKSYAIFSEVSVPVSNSLNVRGGVRLDDYDDVGKLRALRLGAEYQLSETNKLRASLSRGDSAPSFFYLHSDEAQSHPYVDCIPPSGAPPRKCDAHNSRQVKRIARGNPKLKPASSKRISFGFGHQADSSYFVADWYRLTTSNLPGLNFATWSLLNYPECNEDITDKCVERNAGAITIHDSYSNLIKTDIIGLNTRFGKRVETDWGHFAVRGLWRYVHSSKQKLASEKRKYPLPRHAVRVVTSVGRGNVTGYWALNYRDEIENTTGDGKFNSWVGHDLTVDWKIPSEIENLRVTAGVYNVTDEKLSTNTTDPSRTDGPRAASWGRTFFLTLNMRF